MKTPSHSPSAVVPEDPCVLPKDAGRGGESIKRFYYHQARQKCLRFKYKGQGGNDNNFGDKAACKEACGFELPGMYYYYK